MDIQHAAALLKDCPVFQDLDESNLDTLVFLAYTRKFAEGDTIYQKGEKSDNKLASFTCSRWIAKSNGNDGGDLPIPTEHEGCQ